MTNNIETGRGGKLALLALATGGFTIGTTEFTSMSLLPEIGRSLHVDQPTAGEAISAYALGVVLGAPVIAMFAARLPRHRVLIGLMAAIGAANALSGFAPSLGWLLLFRFLSGLPHGAFFGVGALVAASLVPPERRTQAISRMLLGLTVATIAGVPLANLVGQFAGWRWGFGLVALLACLTIMLLWVHVPRAAADQAASPTRELSALARLQVWLTLATGAIGFGGLFCVYTYLAATMTAVTGVSPRLVPVALMLFGVGMTLGTLLCAIAADRALMAAAAITLGFSAGVLALYPAAAHHLGTLLLVVMLVGAGGGLGSILQTRLMDVAGDAQTLAAALNHSAFNTANALGPLLGGLVIAHGFGWTATGWVGSALAVAGLMVWLLAWALDRRGQARP